MFMNFTHKYLYFIFLSLEVLFPINIFQITVVELTIDQSCLKYQCTDSQMQFHDVKSNFFVLKLFSYPEKTRITIIDIGIKRTCCTK